MLIPALKLLAFSALDVMLLTWRTSQTSPRYLTWNSTGMPRWSLIVNGYGPTLNYPCIILNFRQGAFDSLEHEHLQRTKYDIVIDQTSNKPGEQAFEVEFRSLFTGMFELIHHTETHIGSLSWRNHAPCHLWTHWRGYILPWPKHLQAWESLCVWNCVPVPYGEVSIHHYHLLSSVSSRLSDPTDELLMIIGIFSHFFALETTLAERQFFRALAKLIGRRSARLSACGIAAIVSKMGYLDEGCAVGADGSLYNVRDNNIILSSNFAYAIHWTEIS